MRLMAIDQSRLANHGPAAAATNGHQAIGDVRKLFIDRLGVG